MTTETILQINNNKISEQELREFKETSDGRFILSYLEVKAEAIARTSVIAVKANMAENYDLKQDAQIYKNIMEIIKALSNPDTMRQEIDNIGKILKA